MVAAPGHPQQCSKCLPASSKLIDNLFFLAAAHTTTVVHSRFSVHKPAVKNQPTHTHTRTQRYTIDFTFTRRTFKSLLLQLKLKQQTVTDKQFFFTFFPFTRKSNNSSSRNNPTKTQRKRETWSGLWSFSSQFSLYSTNV